MPFPKHIPSQPVDQPLIHFDRAAFDKRYAGYDEKYADPSDDATPMAEVGDFLEGSRAIATPVDVFAFWTSLYEMGGGEVRTYRDQDYTPDNFSPLGRYWTLTRQSGLLIPTRYGATALNFMFIPAAIGQSMTATSDSSDRPGWEFGHTQTQTFELDKNGSTRAKTNDCLARSFRNIDVLRASLSHDELRARAESTLARMLGDESLTLPA